MKEAHRKGIKHNIKLLVLWFSRIPVDIQKVAQLFPNQTDSNELLWQENWYGMDDIEAIHPPPPPPLWKEYYFIRKCKWPNIHKISQFPQ